MSSGDTTLHAGSLLDDNQWHAVEVERNGREVNFTVDRLTITNMTNGDFFQLDLDRYVRIYGIIIIDAIRHRFLPIQELFSQKLNKFGAFAEMVQLILSH